MPLDGCKPFIDQTPGRLQYYKAENEPFIPDSVKWAIRMPARYAIREHALAYEDEVKSLINDYVKMHFNYDITSGKEMDIENMTLGELKTIFAAQSDKIKAMQASGELQSLHKEYDDVEGAYLTGYLQVTDHLDRAIAQIGQSEDDIYTQLMESDARIRLHAQGTFSMAISLAHGDITLNNLQIADKMAESGRDNQVHATELRNLLGARVVILNAKAEVLEALKSDNNDIESKDL